MIIRMGKVENDEGERPRAAESKDERDDASREVL